MKFIKLNKRHLEKINQIDIESEHQGDVENDLGVREIKKYNKERMDKKEEIFFGYKLNDELVGYVTLKPFFPGHKHCELYWLAVKKKYQGQGIGTKLVKFIEKYAKKKKFRQIFIYTGQPMKKTRKFYEKNGYEFINEFKGYYGYPKGNTTAVLYGKTL